MKTARLMLVAASLILTPHAFAQDGTDASGGSDGDAGIGSPPNPGRPDRPRRGHLVRLRGVADGEEMKLFALDMRFRRKKDSEDGPRGHGMVRIGEDRFRAKAVEVEFQVDEEPQPEPTTDAREPADGTDEGTVSDRPDGDDSAARRHRRRRHVSRMVVELYAMDSEPMPEPMPMDEEPGDEPVDSVEDPDIAPVDPPAGGDAIGKLVLERSSRPLGQREVPVASGEASVEGAGYAILARAPVNHRVVRKVRRRLKRRRNRDVPSSSDGAESDAAADSVDGGF